MHYRTKKQIFIGLIYLLILVIAVGGVYWQFFKHKPTCFDGIKNQSEENVDCGGPCEPCEKVYVKDIEVLEVEFISARENFYDVVAVIKNPNHNLGNSEIEYKFSLYNKEGKIVETKKGNTYILPNDTKYIIETKLFSKDDISDAGVELFVKKEDWHEPDPVTIPNLFVKDKILKKDLFSGIVVNNSPFPIREIRVETIVFGKNEEVIALGKTYMKTFSPNEERYFEINWPVEISLGKVQRTEIELEGFE